MLLRTKRWQRQQQKVRNKKLFSISFGSTLVPSHFLALRERQLIAAKNKRTKTIGCLIMTQLIVLKILFSLAKRDIDESEVYLREHVVAYV